MIKEIIKKGFYKVESSSIISKSGFSVTANVDIKARAVVLFKLSILSSNDSAVSVAFFFTGSLGDKFTIAYHCP